jgi:nucleotide-binding universal stress UspA family protein
MVSNQGGVLVAMSNVIVVGVDGSESSIEALRWAVGQAKLTGASLDVVTAWEYPVSYGWTVPWPGDFNPEKEAQDVLAQIIRRELGSDSGLEVQETVVEGHPAPALLEAAKKASLLVVGSRGHGAFAGMMLGSVSEHCASHSSCPVVVVRHTAD